MQKYDEIKCRINTPLYPKFVVLNIHCQYLTLNCY